MRVLLISANTETINMPVLPLGMACVAQAAEQAGHAVRQVNLMVHARAIQELEPTLKTFKPELIGISVRNIDDQSSGKPKFLLEPVRDVVRVCRKHSSAQIVLGGAGYSIFPQRALEFLEADMGIQGEGEGAFVQLLERLETGGALGEVPGLYHRKLGIENPPQVTKDIDTFVLPDAAKQMWQIETASNENIWLPIQTRRGCPLNCSYCSTPIIEGRRIRKRSIDRVLDAMTAYAAAGFERFFFVDNTFNLPPGYAKNLCRAMSRSLKNIQWRGILYPARLDEALAAAMAESGCSDISLGFESGSDRMLAGMNKRFAIKDVRRSAELLKRHGIRCMGFLMLGSPGETRQTVLESLEFVDSLGLDAVKVTVGVRVYPGTILGDHAEKIHAVDSNDGLLRPAFFIEAGMETWIRDTVGAFMAARPHWIG